MELFIYIHSYDNSIIDTLKEIISFSSISEYASWNAIFHYCVNLLFYLFKINTDLNNFNQKLSSGRRHCYFCSVVLCGLTCLKKYNSISSAFLSICIIDWESLQAKNDSWHLSPANVLAIAARCNNYILFFR